MKTIILTALILLAGVFNAFAQEDRYASKTYNLSFQPPENSSKSSKSTDALVTYDEDVDSGVGGALIFEPGDERPDVLLNALSSRNPAAESALAEVFIRDNKAAFQVNRVTVLEKKRLKIANLNAYKITISLIFYGTKMRLSGYYIFAAERKRMYSFLVSATDKGFVKWSAAAEKSVFSLELLKPETK